MSIDANHIRKTDKANHRRVSGPQYNDIVQAQPARSFTWGKIKIPSMLDPKKKMAKQLPMSQDVLRTRHSPVICFSCLSGR